MASQEAAADHNPNPWVTCTSKKTLAVRDSRAKTVVLAAASGGSELLQKSINMIFEEIVSTISGNLLSVRFSNAGELVVDVEDSKDVEVLQRVTSVLNVPVVARVPGTKTYWRCKIEGVDRSYSEASIKASLEDKGVIQVHRVKYLDRQGQHRNTEKVILHFSSPVIPEKVILGASVHAVLIHEAPYQCLWCYGLGHKKSTCPQLSQPMTCKACSGKGHAAKDCPSKCYKCVLCGGAHAADSSNCVIIKKHLLARKRNAVDGSKDLEATPLRAKVCHPRIASEKSAIGVAQGGLKQASSRPPAQAKSWSAVVSGPQAEPQPKPQAMPVLDVEALKRDIIADIMVTVKECITQAIQSLIPTIISAVVGQLTLTAPRQPRDSSEESAPKRKTPKRSKKELKSIKKKKSGKVDDPRRSSKAVRKVVSSDSSSEDDDEGKHEMDVQH